jgi:hypothetical protein
MAELTMRPTAAANEARTASIFRREYHRYVDVFSCYVSTGSQG